MQDKSSLYKITVCAVFSVIAAVVGILESIMPLEFLIPVPGVKLGIANIVIMLTFVIFGFKYALAVSCARAILVFVFSGNAVALIISLSGSFISFIALSIMMNYYGKHFTFIGISATTAAFHGIGQLLAAYFLTGSAVIYYLPVLCTACSLTGIFTGTLMNITENRFSALFRHR